MNVYNFTVKGADGAGVSLAAYEGKVLLIVNTATQCGLTPQYAGLQKLYDRYQARGLEILDFPCNQFLGQAPGTIEDINTFCTLKYNTTFPRFAKVDVNGQDAAPLFVWLREKLQSDVADAESEAFEEKVRQLRPFVKPSDIKWNFCKFLVDRQGNPVTRYSPAWPPEKLIAGIEALL